MECFFEWKYKCTDKVEKLTKSGHVRIQNIIQCSKEYGDGKHEDLQYKLNENNELQIYCHRGCVSTYTSRHHLKRSSKSNLNDSDAASKRVRRSTSTAFDFQRQCIFCGSDCNLEKDRKHPDRWRPSYQFRQLEHGSDNKHIKDVLLEICNERKDQWAAEVSIRLEGAISDLHAADAKYHVDCRCRFIAHRSITIAQGSDDYPSRDQAYDDIVCIMSADTSRIWNSAELHRLYESKGGVLLNRRLLMQKLIDEFKGELLLLSSSGYANMLTFKTKATSILRFELDNDEDDTQAALYTLSKKIKREVKDLTIDKSHYKARLTLDDCQKATSSTVMALLSLLSSSLDSTPASLLIANMITSALKNTYTDLQLAVGVKLRQSKETVQFLHKFHVVCHYDELLRFKKSAAHAASKDCELHGVMPGNQKFTQIVVDNFDADISSQNGKLSTHALAMLVAENGDTDIQPNRMLIQRITKDDMTAKINYEPDIVRYHGPDKPPMPERLSKRSPLPLSLLCKRVASYHIAKENDFHFFKEILCDDNCPEFNGYNTRASRNSGEVMKPRTSSAYLPLIDMTPSHPDTMMTSLVEAQRMTKMTGQEVTVFTCDQQLYRIALHITWVYPDRFSDVVLRLGGMHLLMSFVGSIGTLMADSGLEDLMGKAFAGVPKMLSGKKFPQNVRALRMVVEEVLRTVLNPETMTNGDALMARLEELAARSKTTTLWLDVLIKPVFIIMMYVRAEREGNWPLHLEAVQRMMPYFFSAGHTHYARYGLFYLRSMERMDGRVIEKFLNGDHVMRHIPGYWNGIWSDMWIETTFMRYGHGQGGIIGVTLRPETLKTWALSLHICSQLEQDVLHITEDDEEKKQDKHKEEMKYRIEADVKDRDVIRNQLQLLIDPMQPDSHPENLVNIVSGLVSPAKVNVHEALSVGTKQLNEFETGWPESFHGTIRRNVVTMAVNRKHINLGSGNVIDTNLIYSRVIGLQASSRDVDIHAILGHELAPLPTSMFSDSGDMRICKSKSVMKRLLQVPSVDPINSQSAATMIIDGSALLWAVHWPERGTVQDYLDGFRSNIVRRLEECDVYLVFDRYKEYSTKDATRIGRTTDASRVHSLTTTTHLPTQKVVLTVKENKKQLIALICSDILTNPTVADLSLEHKLVVTGEDDVPTEIWMKSTTRRNDIVTHHEEADNILVQQAMKVASDEHNTVVVISDDTDVFILLLHYYLLLGITVQILMMSPISERAVIDVGLTVDKHRTIIPDLLAAHALSGCDTTACCFGIGKGKVLKTLKDGTTPLESIGDPTADITHVCIQATAFATSCYGYPKCKSTTEARLKAWAMKTGRGCSKMPKLQSLPPTTEAFYQNVLRAHLQTCVWKLALSPDPPNMDPTKFGFYVDKDAKCLLPVTVTQDVKLAPESILKLIKCSCCSSSPCRTNRCGCSNARLACTMFCACSALGCCNTVTSSPDNDDIEA